MSCISGKAGVVQIEGTTIAQVKSYSINESADTTECSFMGQSLNYRTYQSNMKSWEGSAELVWDKQDGVANLAVGGDPVTLTVYPEGTGDNIEGEVLVTSFDISASNDDTISATVSFQGTGPLTRTYA
jgi:hypothetical protein